MSSAGTKVTLVLRLASALLVAALAGCAAPLVSGVSATALSSTDAYTQANRITWGATPSTVERLHGMGMTAYLAAQLHPGNVAGLPAEVQAKVDAMTIVQRPLVNLVQDMEQRRKDADANTNDDLKKTAQQAYQTEMNRLAREAASRHI